MKDNYPSFNDPSFHPSNAIFNQGQSIFASTSTFLAEGNNPHFRLSSLYQDFEQDELALKEFIGVVVTDLNRLRMELLNAFRQNDLALYEQVHYKTLTPLKIIHANTLQDLLAEGRELIEREDIAPKTTLFMNLKKEFAAVLTFLAALK